MKDDLPSGIPIGLVLGIVVGLAWPYFLPSESIRAGDIISGLGAALGAGLTVLGSVICTKMQIDQLRRIEKLKLAEEKKNRLLVELAMYQKIADGLIEVSNCTYFIGECLDRYNNEHPNREKLIELIKENSLKIKENIKYFDQMEIELSRSIFLFDDNSRNWARYFCLEWILSAENFSEFYELCGNFDADLDGVEEMIANSRSQCSEETKKVSAVVEKIIIECGNEIKLCQNIIDDKNP